MGFYDKNALVVSNHQSSCSTILITIDHPDMQEQKVKNRIRKVVAILQWELTSGREQLQPQIHDNMKEQKQARSAVLHIAFLYINALSTL